MRRRNDESKNRTSLIAPLIIALLALAALPGCLATGGGLYTPEIATGQLSNPSDFSFTGPMTATIGGTSYLLADSTGTVSASGNTITATVTDPALPLQLVSPGYAFFDELTTGNCGSLDNLFSRITGATSNGVSTQISASDCDDQAIIALTLDTSQLLDAAGDFGNTWATGLFTVDNAPAALSAATGNTAADGTGTTEASSALFKVGTDQSIVATFSKSITGGTLTTKISGPSCTTTIASTSLVSGQNGTVVVWTVSGASAGQTCTLDVSGITDAIGNPYDPHAVNLTMSIGFQ